MSTPERSKGRERRYSAPIQKGLFDAKGGVYNPVPRAHNVKSGVKTFEQTTGTSVAESSMRRIIDGMQHTSDASLLLQYALLPELIAELKVEDPSGTYILEEKQTGWSEHSFRRLYFSLGAVKDYQRPEFGRIELVGIDAAHMCAGPFPAHMWYVQEIDANQTLTILAYAITLGENAEDAAWIIARFREDFPGVSSMVHDLGVAFLSKDAEAAKTGVTAKMQEQAQKMGVEVCEYLFTVMCAEHYTKHVVTRHLSGVSPGDIRDCVYALARARTPQAVADALEQARQIKESLRVELDEVKENLAICYRLQRGIASHGVVNSNGNESANNATDESRVFGPVGWILYQVDRARQAHQEKAKSVRKFSTNVATEWTFDEVLARLKVAVHGDGEARTHQAKIIEWVQCDAFVLEARLMRKGSKRVRHCKIVRSRMPNQSPEIVCDCEFFCDYGMLCGLLSFMMFTANSRPGDSRGCWDYMSKEFLCFRRSKRAYEGRYAPEAKFPVLSGFMGLLSEPRQRLDNLLCASVLENGVSSLPLYPGDQKPRAEYETHPKKQATKKKGSKRHKSTLEKMSKKKKKKTTTSSQASKSASSKRKANADEEDERDDGNDEEEDDDEEFEEVPLPEKPPQRELYPGEEALYMQADSSPVKKKKTEKADYTCQRCGGGSHTRPKCESGDISHLLRTLRCFPGQIESLQQGKRWLGRYNHHQRVLKGDMAGSCCCSDCCDGFRETSLRYGKVIIRALGSDDDSDSDDSRWGADGEGAMSESVSSISFESEEEEEEEDEYNAEKRWVPYADDVDNMGMLDGEKLERLQDLIVHGATFEEATAKVMQQAAALAPPPQLGYHSFSKVPVVRGQPPLPSRNLGVVYALSETARKFVFKEVEDGVCAGQKSTLSRLNEHLGAHGEAAAKTTHLKAYLAIIARWDAKMRRFVLLPGAARDADAAKEKAKSTAPSGHVLQEQFTLERLSPEVTGWLDEKLRADERLAMVDLVKGARSVALERKQGLPTDKVVRQYVGQSGAKWHPKGTQYVLPDEYDDFVSSLPHPGASRRATVITAAAPKKRSRHKRASPIYGSGDDDFEFDDDDDVKRLFGGFSASSAAAGAPAAGEFEGQDWAIADSLRVQWTREENAEYLKKNPPPQYTDAQIEALRAEKDTIVDPLDLELVQEVINSSGDAKDLLLSLQRIRGTHDGGWLNDTGVMLVLEQFWSSLQPENTHLQLLSALLYRHNIGTERDSKEAEPLELKLSQIITKKKDAAAAAAQQQQLFVPLNLRGNHWALAVVNVQLRTIFVIDSLNASACNRVEDYGWPKFLEICRGVWGCEFETVVKSCKRQLDGSSCGIHLLVNALLVAVGIDPKARNSPLKCTTMQEMRNSIADDLEKEGGCTFEWMGKEWQTQWKKLQNR